MRIAVFSCDKYNWVLPIFWHFYKKNWSNNPYPTDIITESQKILFHDNVFYGGKRLWSDIAIAYLKSISDDLIMLILDDYIIEKVDMNIIKLSENELSKPDVGAIRLSNREHDGLSHHCFPYNDNFIEYPKDKPYSLSFQVGMWKREYLLSLLRGGHDIWEPEIEGSKRMALTNKSLLFSKDIGVYYVPGGCMRRGNEPVKNVWDWIKENWQDER